MIYFFLFDYLNDGNDGKKEIQQFNKSLKQFAFYEKIDAQIKVVNTTLENRNTSVEVIKALKEAGNVNEVAVKQTEAQQYAAQIILEDLKYNVNTLIMYRDELYYPKIQNK